MGGVERGEQTSGMQLRKFQRWSAPVGISWMPRVRLVLLNYIHTHTHTHTHSDSAGEDKTHDSAQHDEGWNGGRKSPPPVLLCDANPVAQATLKCDTPNSLKITQGQTKLYYRRSAGAGLFLSLVF